MEAIAAEDRQPEGRVAAHLASCPNCAAALVSARTLEGLLRRRAVPAAPAQFTSRTLARVRRARWRSDQFLDVGFNVAVIAVVLAVIGGTWLLLNRSGLAAVSNDAVDLFGTALVTVLRRVTPSLPLYGAATAVLATALVIWWWAERDATL